MAYGNQFAAAKIINDTSAHTGRFGKVVALNDSVINTLVAEDISGDLTGISVSATGEICGVITSVKLDSGTVVAYLL